MKRPRLVWPLVLLASAPPAAAAWSPKPNIVVIVSDDQGWTDLGANGAGADAWTPNLDALAQDGVRFERGYVSAPQCVPSRAGLVTGRYQERFGVDENGKGPLPLAEKTLAERLQAAGYATGQVGKWHLGLPLERAPRDRAADPFLPHAQGFEEYFCGTACSYVASHDLAGHRLPNAPATVSDTRFRVAVQTEAAVSFIERHRQDPFFLYVGYFAPHIPPEAPEPWFSGTPAGLPVERRMALAMIAAMDDGVEAIRAALRPGGLDQNTLIFFLSDNGATLKEGAWNGSLNLPAVGEKGMLTDGGVRVPFVAAWPEVFPAGTVFAAPVSALDVAATAIAAAGLAPDPTLDGVNLIPFLTGEKPGAPHEFLYWRWRSQSAVLAGRWKLVLLGPGRVRYLFDLDSPEGERKNRASEHPERVQALAKQLEAWSATLDPPGLPREVHPIDEAFFDAYLEGGSSVLASQRPVAETAQPWMIGGWEGRNARLLLHGEALRVEPEAGAGAAQAYLQHDGLAIAGPVEVRLRLHAQGGGKGGIGWRLQGQERFPSDQFVRFEVPPLDDWQEVRVSVPAKGTLVDARVVLPRGQRVDVGAVEIFSQVGGAEPALARAWRFPEASGVGEDARSRICRRVEEAAD